MYDRLGEIKRQHKHLKKENFHGVTIHPRDTDWLIEQAETLRKIANRWVEIETNGTYEEASDFYTFVQDVLSEEQLN